MNRKIKNYIFFSLTFIIIIYSAFRLWPIILGPKIVITSPSYGERVATSTFYVSGQIFRAKDLHIEDRQVSFDKNGEFRENFVFTYPYTILNISATDSWGRTVKKELLVNPK